MSPPGLKQFIEIADTADTPNPARAGPVFFKKPNLALAEWSCGE
jgi:hypothetical protein